MKFSVWSKDSKLSEWKTLKEARGQAKDINAEDETKELFIMKGTAVAEVWTGPVTFITAGPDAMIAYSDADIDSIGAVREAGSVYSARNRGVNVGTFGSLYGAAIALHEHAKSAAYMAA